MEWDRVVLFVEEGFRYLCLLVCVSVCVCVCLWLSHQCVDQVFHCGDTVTSSSTRSLPTTLGSRQSWSVAWGHVDSLLDVRHSGLREAAGWMEKPISFAGEGGGGSDSSF